MDSVTRSRGKGEILTPGFSLESYEAPRTQKAAWSKL